MPRMRFVFLGPEVRLQLPSDTSSRGLPLLFGSEFPSSRPPEDSHLLVTSRLGFPHRFSSFVHHARRFAPCPAHVGQASRLLFRAARAGHASYESPLTLEHNDLNSRLEL